MIKKLITLFILLSLFVSGGFAFSLSDVPTSDLYSSSFFSFFQGTQNLAVDSSLFPFFVASENWVSTQPKPKLTTTVHLVKKHLNQLNPKNDNNGRYESSFVKIYRVTNGKAYLEQTLPIDINEQLYLSPFQQYRVDIYNYDLCSYYDKYSSSYSVYGLFDKCKSQSGTVAHVIYQKKLNDAKLNSQRVKKWLISESDSTYIKEGLTKMKLQTEVLKNSYNACVKEWYRTYTSCNSREYKVYQEALSNYNSAVIKTNRNEKLSALSLDRNLNNIDNQIKVLNNLNTYYKNKAKIVNKPKYDKKTQLGQYKQTTGFIQTMQNDLSNEFKKTVVLVKKGQNPQLAQKQMENQMIKDTSEPSFLSKVGSFFIVTFFVGLIVLAFYKIPVLSRFKIYGWSITGLFYLLYLIF